MAGSTLHPCRQTVELFCCVWRLDERRRSSGRRMFLVPAQVPLNYDISPQLLRKFRSCSGFATSAHLRRLPGIMSSMFPFLLVCWTDLFAGYLWCTDVLFAQILFAHILSSRANWSYCTLILRMRYGFALLSDSM